MIKGMESVLLFSQNAKKLADFYKEKVGLKVTNEFMMGEKDEVYEFKMKQGTPLYVIDHSKIKGKNKTPERMMINLEVDDIEKEVKRLTKARVKKTQDIYHVEGYGYIATFEDLDGNFFQLVQVRASK
ncbi:hypothetical protein A3A46_00615 [Candidatus Roizmanbacteria bacterium RIFCSPLOWO2_01_FULL_37_13]|uniref:VOC domain-containing protein n=1 Tax=Candidatus Roizmanbacteria bacterium RIFCSPHIGHO2_02_FULL_38_11 TaxID=1802039 RepID=A0A1F7H211_9BACT|nr:MAG: hypothetical protein A3C25_02475 [Candidatus Roizmanbacteria bacterium RIFCSPHIGHO2_02_FULL_38_11]OGK34282.1 MAG: hypothetical protein A3F58_00935 [Candidatus Roizmanbacteria bacterium RIFCSPHIGHO2_12_FULL_37_9b]OGK43240.1 MAG: hypothetical protein A3A46_00615 [Candidatus Roizmanbacteria bacterium RIFCSPLOWO2_01_FULL_37_13]